MRIEELIRTRHAARNDPNAELVARACSKEAAQLMRDYGGSSTNPNVIYLNNDGDRNSYTIHQICTPTESVEVHRLWRKMQALSCYPICNDPGGDFFCELQGGPIVLFDHEEGTICPVANNFNEFFDLIETDKEDPELYRDPDAIGWVDPDFKPEF